MLLPSMILYKDYNLKHKREELTMQSWAKELCFAPLNKNQNGGTNDLIQEQPTNISVPTNWNGDMTIPHQAQVGQPKPTSRTTNLLATSSTQANNVCPCLLTNMDGPAVPSSAAQSNMSTSMT